MKAERTEHERKIIAVKRLLAGQDAKDSLVAFTRLTMPDPDDVDNPDLSLYQVAPHHKLIAEAVQDFESGKRLRVCLSIGPQHGKSELISRRGIAWMLGKRPYRNIMFGTYNQDFANEFGDDIRSIVTSKTFQQIFPHCELRTGSKAKDHMVTTQRGKLSLLGRGGSGTGRPADLFVIDDPCKDAKEAESLTIRDDIWNWFTKVVYTRCHTASGIFIVATRWHEDDLIGRLTDPSNPYYVKEVADKWLYINVPAILDDAKIAATLGKQVGESLWPERFSLEHLESARSLNPNGFSALYQGRPTPPEGSFFKNTDIHTYALDKIPTRGNKYMTGDLALSVERDRDHSCVGNWMLDENDDLYLLPDLYWEQKSADESVDKIVEFIHTHSPLVAWWERGQIAKAVGPFLEKRMMEERSFTNIEALPSAASKAAKCTSIRGRMRQGKVFFPAFAPWWPRAKEQLLKFTGSGDDKSDDFCDMCGLIGQGLGDQIRIGSPKAAPSNVVNIGSIKWVKWAHDQERRAENRRKALKGW